MLANIYNYLWFYQFSDPTVLNYVVIFSDKVSKNFDFVCGTAVTACVVKMHSPSREILQHTRVDGFSEGVPREKRRSSWR